MPCCISKLGKWLTFDKAWKGMLRKEKLEYIHAIDLFHAKTPYTRENGWSFIKRQKLARLIDKIINRDVSYGVCLVLNRDDFNWFKNTPDKNFNNMLESDYGLAFRMCLSWLNAFIPVLYPNEKNLELQIFYEEGHPKSGCIQVIFDKFKADVPGAFIKSEPKSARKAELYGLQAADVFGYNFLYIEREKKFDSHLVKIEDSLKFNNKGRFFRVPINRDTLADLRDAIILQKPRVLKKYRHLLTDKEKSTHQTIE